MFNSDNSFIFFCSRNAQVTFVDTPQLKINSFQHRKDWYLIHTWLMVPWWIKQCHLCMKGHLKLGFQPLYWIIPGKIKYIKVDPFLLSHYMHIFVNTNTWNYFKLNSFYYYKSILHVLSILIKRVYCAPQSSGNISVKDSAAQSSGNVSVISL